MIKGIGKCIVCGNDEMATANLTMQVSGSSQQDLEYFMNMRGYACTNCGFIQLTSSKVGK